MRGQKEVARPPVERPRGFQCAATTHNSRGSIRIHDQPQSATRPLAGGTGGSPSRTIVQTSSSASGFTTGGRLQKSFHPLSRCKRKYPSKRAVLTHETGVYGKRIQDIVLASFLQGHDYNLDLSHGPPRAVSSARRALRLRPLGVASHRANSRHLASPQDR